MALPDDAPPGLHGAPGQTRIGPKEFRWGGRTYVMGIINVTPDSFSGDGLLSSMGRPVEPGARGRHASSALAETALAQARRMADEGADILDIGGESTRPGHDEVDVTEELARVVPVIEAIRAALPDVPLSIDTTKPSVAKAAIDVGADLVNTVWGVDRPGTALRDDPLIGIVGDRGVPIILMHNRLEARYTNLLAEVVADLEHAIETALELGIARDRIIVDPGFGFGKAPVHNIALLAGLGSLRMLGRPILLGTSRKSTLGKILDLPADERLEATLATTVLGIAAGVDIVRVHDVRANVRAARIADAIVRGSPFEVPVEPAGRPS